jgi:hypothetical protein
MASQVQLTNTFNEFRQAYNEAANDVTELQSSNTAIFEAVNGANSAASSANSLLYSGTTQIFTKGAQIADLNSIGSRVVFGNAPISGTGAVLSDDDGFIYHSGNNSVDLAGTIVAGNVTSTGNLESDGNFSVGTSKFTVDASTGDVVAEGNLELTFAESRIDAYHIHAELHVGAGGDVEDWAAGKGTDPEQHKIFGIGDEDAPVDMVIVNESDGEDAYAEFIAVNDTGDVDNGWCSFGINSSNYAAAQYGVTKADDGYLLYQPPANTTLSGDLVIGTGGNGTGNKIIFSANGFDDPANNTQMTITPGEKVEIVIDTESSNTSTGALVVQGGIGLQGNLNVGGNVTITGEITLGGGGNTVSLDSLQVDGPIVFVANGNPGDTFDIGIVGEFTDGGSIERYTGFVRDATDSGVYKLFSNANAAFQTDIANTVDFTDPDLVFADVRVGAVTVSATTASSSNTTGALVVAGGVGISGAVNASNLIRLTDTTASTSTSSGAIVISGGVGVAGNTHIGGELVVNNASITGTLTTESVTETTTDITGNGVTTFNFNNGNVFQVAPTAAYTPNFTNVPTTANRVFAMTLIVTQDGTPRAISGVQIDGVAQTIKYAGNTVPTFTANKTEIVVFSLIRTSGDAWTVLGQLSQYG